VNASSAPWIVGVPAPAVRYVVRLRQRWRCSFPKEERFYMRRTAREVNPIILMIDPGAGKSSSLLEQSIFYSEFKTNQKLNSDWSVSSSVRTVGN
jgi:hypothetical protein